MITNKQSTLASLSGITVVPSAFQGAVFDLSAVPGRDRRLFELFAEFVTAPMVLDDFAHHDERRRFWAEVESVLSAEDRCVVRTNPLKWGMVSAVVAMIPVYDIQAPAVTLEEYNSWCLEQKIDYVNNLREALTKLLASGSP